MKYQAILSNDIILETDNFKNLYYNTRMMLRDEGRGFATLKNNHTGKIVAIMLYTSSKRMIVYHR